MSDKTVRVSCTSWITVDISAVANFDNDIHVGERIYSESEKCYVKKVKLELTADSSDELYELLGHMKGACNDYDCKYCQEVEEGE